MSDVYRIFGSEISPYSVKVRSYVRYKGIPHEWIERNSTNQTEFKKYAKLPLIPLIIAPDDQAMQDSTPILESLESRFPEPSIHPEGAALGFLSALIEEFGDEWGNKWMFHYRWARPADRDSAAGRIVRSMMPGLSDEQYSGMADGIKERMAGRVWFVGSNEQTAPQIEQSYRDGIAILERHLEGRKYLFGARPSFGDFGLWGQVYNAWTDPTAGEIIESGAPHVKAWVERMLEPKAEGDFETWSSLESTLQPFLREQVGALFLPWSDANAKALAAGEEEFSCEIASGTWIQKPQKYHAKSLLKLRAKYAEAACDELDAILDASGCTGYLRGV